MRHVIRGVLVAAVLSVPLPLHAQKNFEGTVTYQTSMGGRPGEIIFMSRGTKVRQEMRMGGAQSMGDAAMIFDAATGAVMTVVPEQRVYIKTTMKEIMAMLPQQGAKDTKPLAIKPAGKKETIAGHVCEVYQIGDRGEACVSTELGRFLASESMSQMSAGSGPKPMSDLMKNFKNGAVPLRMRFALPGEPEMNFIATKVDRTAVPADKFVAPAGFTEMKMPTGGGAPGAP